MPPKNSEESRSESLSPSVDGGPRTSRTLRFGEFTLDLQRRALLRNGERVHLTEKPLAALIRLTSSPGQVVTKRALMDDVWKDTIVTEDSLVQAIGEVRRALGDDRGDPRFVQTVPREGYRFIGEVRGPELLSEVAVPRPEAAQQRGPRRRVLPLAGGVLVAAGALSFAVVGIRTALRPPFEPFIIGASAAVAITPAMEMEPAISPDGKLVAYAAETPVGSRIFVQHVAGGRPLLLTAELGGDHRWPRWAPDQSRIVFVSQGVVYVVPALGGPPQRVMESASGPLQTPAWSPDGEWIAYADHDGISVSSLDGNTRRVVGGVSLHSPSWSPNGALLAYAQGIPPAPNNRSTSAVWIVPVSEGGTPRQLSDSVHVNVSPVWAPDGNSVLYVSSRGGALDVFQQPIRSDGSPVATPRRLTTALNVHTITLSADGSRMAYDVVVNRSTVWTTSIMSGGVRRTSSAARITQEKERIEGLSLSHDGDWLAYDSDRAGGFDIYKVRADGSQSTRLTTAPANDFLPTWSPDDRELAFHSTRNGTRDVYVVSAEGTGEAQVTSGPSEDFAPSWSPDGRSLVFRGLLAGTHRVYVVTRGAGGRWSVPRAATPDSIRDAWVDAAWSPDGSVIAFMRPDAVATVRPDGRDARILADSIALGGAPTFLTWGSDPSRVYVTVLRRGTNAVVAVPLAGGSPETLLIEEASHRMRPEFATDGRRIFFTSVALESDVWTLGLQR